MIGAIIDIPDEATLLEAAQQACASHLTLVIDIDGQAKLTPFLLPGMVKVCVVDKQFAEERKAA